MSAAQSLSKYLVLSLLSLILFSKPVFAQDSTTNPNIGEPVGPNNYGMLQHASGFENSLTAGTLCLLDNFNGFKNGCSRINVDTEGNPKFLVYTGTPGSGGLIGGLNTMTLALYSHPPTSTTYYLAKAAKNFGLVTPVYAQSVSGSGAGILTPVSKLWEVFRNISYVAYIFVFIATGFLVMFRRRLNPQTIISVQAALPGLIIGLLLITFSYLIAALFIDLGFVSIQLLGNLFSQITRDNGSILNAFDPQKLATQSNVLELFNSSVQGWQNHKSVEEGLTGVLDSIRSGFPLGGGVGLTLISTVIGAIVGFLILGPLGLAVAGVVGGVGGFAASSNLGPFVASLIVPLILIIALTVQFFKLFFKLLTAYAMLLIITVLGPLLILIGTVPGRGNIISFWWKNLLGNALVFPAVFGVFLFAGMILATEPWVASPPLFGGLDTRLLQVIVAYVIILGSPAIVDVTKKLIGAQDLGDIAKTGLVGFATGAGAVGIAGGRAWKGATAPLERLRESYWRRKGEAWAAGQTFHDPFLEHWDEKAAKYVPGAKAVPGRGIWRIPLLSALRNALIKRG
ncbi:hypothetical protein HYS93_01135 [Candidatus Daviesbacteria bacterium]|nr:hypothetical protein [Candidatus Daviesbacteria bacterium]